MKLDVKVKEVSEEKSVLEVKTKSGLKTLTISKTQFGHSYEDFSNWEISDDNYYDLEELVDKIMDRMSNKSSLNVNYDL